MKKILFSFLLPLCIGSPLSAQTWNQQTSGTSNDLNGICFTDPNNGYGAENGGSVMKTTNGGATWTHNPISGVNFYAIAFAGSTTGIVVGDNGTIFRTTNAGSTWGSVTSNTANHLRSIYFIDLNNGFACGDNGTILKTTNGGSTWTTQSSGTVNQLLAIRFTDVNNGWVVGATGTIVRTSNGGASWATQSSGTTATLRAVFCNNVSTAFVSGAGGVMKKTTDGGTTWNTVTTGNPNGLNAIYFNNLSVGFVAVDDGNILTTTNGGASWSPTSCSSINSQRSIFFNNNFGWSCTWGGEVWKTDLCAGYVVSAGPNKNICAGGSVNIGGAPTVLAGTPPYSISWNPGGMTIGNPLVSPASNTIYTVTATDLNGCSAPPSTVNVTVNPNPTVTVSGLGTICADQTVTITAAGANTYTWNTSANTASISISPTVTTSYTVSGTNGFGCVNTVSVTESVNPLPNMTSPNTANICSGGTASISLTSDISSTYSWFANNNPNTTGEIISPQSTYTINNTITNDVSNTEIVIYNVTPTSLSGCNGPAQTVSVTVYPTPDAVATPTLQTICSGTGSSVNLSGSVAGTTYTWTVGQSGVSGGSNSSGSTIADVLTNTTTVPGTASYTITPGANGCIGSDITATVSVNPLPSATVSPASSTICSGGSTSINLSSNLAGTTYAWTVGQTNTSGASNSSGAVIAQTINATSNVAGTAIYSVTPTKNGCAGSMVTGTVTVNPLPTPTVTPASQTICSGTSASISLSSNVAGSTYNWIASQSGVSGATSGGGSSIAQTITTTTTSAGTATYSVSATANGCTGSGTIATVTVNPIPSMTVSPTSQTICSGGSTSISMSSNVAGTTYAWTVTQSGVTGASASSGASVSQVLSTTSGSPGTATYTITPTAAGCSGALSSATATVIPNPTVAISGGGTICSGASATLTASGATSYSWNTGPTTTSITVSPSSTTSYTVVGTSSGCSTAATSTVTVNATPTVSISGGGSICSGSSATLSASGATSYSWSPGGATTSTLSVSPASTTSYTVTGTSSGCSSIATTTVNVTATPTINISGGGPICTGASATLTATGATTYTWSPGGSNANSIIVSPGSTTVYTVSGTTASCSSSTSTTVTVNALPGVSASSTSLCYGTSQAISASGANTYSWSPGTGLSATTGAVVTANPTITTVYTITGTDANGCVGNATSTVTVYALPGVAVNSLTLCAGSTGTLTATGANTYVWNPTNGLSASNGAAVAANPTVTTSYTVTGTDVNGCVNNAVANVTINSSPTVTTTGSSTICAGNTATLTASGANTYTWNTGSNSTSIVVSPAATTSYTVDGTDGSGCTATDVVTVVVNALPVINANSASICAGQTTATLTATGANSYTWSPASGLSSQFGTSVTASPSSSTTYTIDGIDANGCQGSGTATVTVMAPPIVSANGVDATCFGLCNGSGSATGANTYTWTPGGMTGATVAALCPNTYTVIGTDANGCVNDYTLTINEPAALSVSFSSVVNASCNGSGDGSVTGNASGGTPAYSWSWSNSATTQVITGLNAGNFTLTVTDANNCNATGTVTIGTNSVSPMVSVSGATVTCQGQDVPMTGSASGGSAPYTYTWYDSQTASQVSTLTTCTVTPLLFANDTVTLSVTDALGCVGSFAQVIQVNYADSLSGFVTDNVSNPVTAGVVYLFEQKLNHVGLADTVAVVPIQSNGLYTFPNVFYGEYFVKVVADTNVYPTSIGTYYSTNPNAYQWDSAQQINHYSCNASNVSIYNVQILQTSGLTGPGTISGIITEGVGYGHRYGNGHNSPMGAPLKGVDVKLGRNPGGSPAARTTTDANGNYTFSHVPVDSYRIYVDIPNFGMDSIIVINLTATDTVSSNNNYYVDSVMIRVDTASGGLGVHSAQSLDHTMEVYPNPASSYIHVVSSTPLGAVKVYNSLGEMVLSETQTSLRTRLDLSNLKAGVYIVEVQGRHVRFVKE